MKKNRKHLIGILLLVCVMVSCIHLTGLAKESAYAQSCTMTLDQTKSLYLPVDEDLYGSSTVKVTVQDKTILSTWWRWANYDDAIRVVIFPKKTGTTVVKVKIGKKTQKIKVRIKKSTTSMKLKITKSVSEDPEEGVNEKRVAVSKVTINAGEAFGKNSMEDYWNCAVYDSYYYTNILKLEGVPSGLWSSIVWSVDNPKIVRVTPISIADYDDGDNYIYGNGFNYRQKDGKKGGPYVELVGLKTGTTTVRATVNGKTVKIKVTVVKPKVLKVLTKYGVNETMYMTKGDTQTASANMEATYTSSNKKIFTVDKDGQVTAKKEGEATLIVKSGKQKVEIPVRVRS